MRTLFFRIFLWFWVAMALAGAILFFTSLRSAERPMHKYWHNRMHYPIMLHGDALAVHFENGGKPALIASMKRIEGMGRLKVYLFDQEGKEVLGNKPPEPVIALSRRAFKTGSIERERKGGLHFAAWPVSSPEGKPHVLATGLTRPWHPPPVLTIHEQVLRIVILIVVAGGVCYLLARQLTFPLAALRRAATRLRRGELSVRVGDTVKRRRDEIGDLARDFDSMAERIESLVTSQRRLLRDISHELRSPLARLNVALELARQKTGKDAECDLDRIALESERLDRLTGRLLTLTRLESGTDEGERTDIELRDHLDQLVADARFEAQAKNCTVVLKASDSFRIRGVADLLHAAFENVIRNAVQYTAVGTKVEVSLHRKAVGEEERAVIRVRDQGPGIPEKELENVFRPFFRVTDARDRQTGGTGLGLAITARAVQLHGGSVKAANAPDNGLIVELTLPFSMT
ncbi:sensor histidine kinase [Acidobacteriota bacterium]